MFTSEKNRFLHLFRENQWLEGAIVQGSVEKSILHDAFFANHLENYLVHLGIVGGRLNNIQVFYSNLERIYDTLKRKDKYFAVDQLLKREKQFDDFIAQDNRPIPKQRIRSYKTRVFTINQNGVSLYELFQDKLTERIKPQLQGDLAQPDIKVRSSEYKTKEINDDIKNSTAYKNRKIYEEFVRTEPERRKNWT